MLRLTGPGKIRNLVVPADGRPETTIASLLFNFDIDGDTLKPQHRDFLVEHVLPQLNNPAVKVSLRGESSRSGSDAHNLELSARRVKNVEKFLRGFGPIEATITTTSVGEADATGRGEDDKTEDETVRAVIVSVENSAHSLVPPTFDSEGNFMGFDPTANPPWLMLPAGSSSRLMRINNAEGLTLISNNPGVVRVRSPFGSFDKPLPVTQQSQIFRVLPGVTSDAVISAVDRTGKPRAQLGVSVLRERKVQCAFHYVRNPRYGTRVRNPGDEGAFVDALNNVWGSQANIAFTSVGAFELPMTANLGDVIDTRAKFEIIGANRKRGVQLNVFFVHNVEEKPGANAIDGLTDIGPPGDCLFDDFDESGDDPFKLVLAHEAGHCLTLDHNTPTVTTSQMLMHATVSKPFLTKAQVLQARRAVIG